jgi:hypothetical protein
MVDRLCAPKLIEIERSRLGFSGYLSSMKHCFLGLLGDFDLDYYMMSPNPTASVIVLLLYVVLITILLLNLLIAMMGDTYADVKRSAKRLWSVVRPLSHSFVIVPCPRHLERTRIALDIERNMSVDDRQSKQNKYWLDLRNERYLQVEQVNNDRYQVHRNESDED